MNTDIELYVNSELQGFYPINVIEKYFSIAEQTAEETIRSIEWDQIVLYAIFAYDPKTGAILSANMMCICLTKEEFQKLYPKFPKSCRLFTLRKK